MCTTRSFTFHRYFTTAYSARLPTLVFKQPAVLNAPYHIEHVIQELARNVDREYCDNKVSVAALG